MNSRMGVCLKTSVCLPRLQNDMEAERVPFSDAVFYKCFVSGSKFTGGVQLAWMQKYPERLRFPTKFQEHVGFVFRLCRCRQVHFCVNGCLKIPGHSPGPPYHPFFHGFIGNPLGLRQDSIMFFGECERLSIHALSILAFVFVPAGRGSCSVGQCCRSTSPA